MADEKLDDFLGVKPVPRWRRWLKWALVALGFALIALTLTRCFGGAEAVQYSTTPARRGDLTVSVSATGKLAPTNQVTVGSQLSGLVTRVVVDVNDRVSANQPLALIDPEQIDAQIRQGEAAVASAQAQVNQARATVSEAQAQLARLEEVRRLSGGRVPSAAELQTGRANAQRAVASLRVAEASVVQAQAQLSQSRTQRARSVIRSPVSGVVLARQIDPGQTVAASFNTPTLFVIAEDLTRMRLEVAIDEADVGQVKVGQRASFTVDAFPGRTFPAEIIRVDLGSNQTVSAASASTATTTTGQVVSYAADLSVANPTGLLRPGMTATADIVTSAKRGVLLVPNAAFRFRPSTAGAQGGGIAGAIVPRGRRGGAGQQRERTATVGRGGTQAVYVRGPDGQPVRRAVTTGDSDGSLTEVLSGLRAGEQVITGQLAGEGDAAPKSGGQGSGRRQAAGAGGG